MFLYIDFLLIILVMYYVYILESSQTGKYYIGYTSCIATRLTKHNAGATRSTRPGIPWNLVYFESYKEKGEALRREKEIKKKKSRVYIENLIFSFKATFG